jgi:hypothetical protein
MSTKKVINFVIDFNYKVYKKFVIFKAIMGPKDRKNIIIFFELILLKDKREIQN